ncbi:branched-chain amino acid transport system ATP-binding protein [Rhizobium pisi]|jgi:branched-chain amino acid transport system ATP-binding protein|uniref:ABC transporter ATP-binding protein n=2 Tax=Rhizobium TaxID=379 RepID=A0A7W6B4N5_9HYPH|nr:MULTISPECIES: ABC transporter ATP-binding protein [Rhizobium]MBB3137062.1 branched-chain amino acid transport system ATP-binding protein [Rhizobium pisi]MBB3913828.1 branched-chain amino acid transport system ATP-binding protein [Rhizobium fabae]RSB66704.1 ABC transporter ATP-binding protein [Rhizobium pisi]RUM13560.1 ABC transporter ATP-binding protein [Rhizobium fabae]TCA50091.1 ABC transporter ATP-binding protein [Rhizobium pisi]
MALLETHGLTAFYGDFQALFGVDITLNESETVAVIGANGAGKSTLLRSISGLIRNVPGHIRFDGGEIGALAAPDVLQLGITMVPEGRRLFPSLSVEENLLIGKYGRVGNGAWSLDTIYDLFPVLKEHRHRPGTALSGGQQQMVAIGRALISNPRVLLCDEVSLGLAPVVVRDIYAAFPKIRATGASIVIIEQDIGQALKVADRVYCMMEGRVTLTGAPTTLSREDIHAAYFGAHAR